MLARLALVVAVGLARGSYLRLFASALWAACNVISDDAIRQLRIRLGRHRNAAQPSLAAVTAKLLPATDLDVSASASAASNIVN